ncbi:MAG: hypothetical protein WAU39_14965 [Polyangiales bacterium]
MGDTFFPEGPRTIAESAELELNLRLTGMFFDLAPVTGAGDGLYQAGGNERNFLIMNLIGTFDLRVLP